MMRLKPQPIARGGEPLFTGNDWDFDTIRRIHAACEGIAGPELGQPAHGPDRDRVEGAVVGDGLSHRTSLTRWCRRRS